MNRRGSGRTVPSVLPVPTRSQGSPASSMTSSQGLRGRTKLTHSAEDIPKQYSLNLSQATESDQPASSGRKSVVLVESRRGSLTSPQKSSLQTDVTRQPGVRYITEDLIKKVAKEDNLDLITSLNLTLAGEKKIKYLENLNRLHKLQTLNLSSNIIEHIECLDRLVQLRELNLASNMLTKIEGLETLTSLQSLNVSDNYIEHIPLWFAKKMKSLRTFRIARNKLTSLFEVTKLKALPDLTQIHIAGNPVCDIPHCRMYVVFHLRTLEVIDGKPIHNEERKQAQDRLALDEVKQLENKLEQEEQKYKQLEEAHNKSLQEQSLHESSHTQLMSKEKSLQSKLKQMEQELASKDEQLKKKTVLLNKASQKHYQLEQELAFYKIDSKFNTLSEVPQFQVESADDSGDIQEGPYIGRAVFVANQFAQESIIKGATPQVSHTHTVMPSSGIVQVSMSSSSKEPLHTSMNLELEKKQAEVQKTEEKLRSLQSDLSATERKLLNATTELKKISIDRITPEPFRDDNSYKLRQRLTRKMQKVNELRDTAAQVQTEIDRKQEKISADRSEILKMKNQFSKTDTSKLNYEMKQKEMTSKEFQINLSNQAQVELQKQLEETYSNIAQETADIKALQEQLSANHTEPNDELRHELDDIVLGLSGYLENVKGQSLQHKQDFEIIVQEKEGLEEKIRHMEVELQALESEARNARQMQQKLTELEDSLRKTEELNATLQDEVNRSQQKDPDLQNRLQRAEDEAKQLRLTLTESEKKTEMEWKTMQKQLQTEKERAEKMTQRIQDVNRQDLETKKLVSQLEAAKALNAGLRDQIEEFKHRQQMEEGGFRPSDLKKRLKKFIHEFKTNKNPIEPQDRSDILGMTFQDLQKHAQQQLNNSAKEINELKKIKEKTESEVKTLKEKLKKADTTSKIDKLEGENKRLQEDIKKLKNLLEEAKNKNKEGAIPVRIVYRPDSDSGDRASSLNSDEKHLFDELQRELLGLKQMMRHHENDLSKKVTEAETEAAHWKDEVKQKEKEFEAELEIHRQASELMKEKQEARIQVIAQDLDQAQFIAESLQHMLEDRELALHEELNNTVMSNQMISAQEEELAKLYDILEAQRIEIENLNQMLDHLAQQGPDGVGAAFDDELWRIRQEVNSLKETLAMQSAYVQAMPGVGHMSSQADGLFPYGALGPQDHLRKSGAAVGTQIGGSRRHGSVPTTSGRMPVSQVSTRAATTADHYSGVTAGSTLMTGAAASMTNIPRSSQSASPAGDPQEQHVEHLGTERRESKAPPLGKSAVGKSEGGGTLNQQEHRTHDKAFDKNGTANLQNKPGHSRSDVPHASLPSVHEPLQRPKAYHLHESSPPQQGIVHVHAPAIYTGRYPAPSIPGLTSQPTHRPYLPHHIGPNRASQTSGVQSPSKAVLAGAGQQRVPPPVSCRNYSRKPERFQGHVASTYSGHLPNTTVPSHAGNYVYGMDTTQMPALMTESEDTVVTFNPVPSEITKYQGSSVHDADGSPDQLGGSFTYLTSGPAQIPHYGQRQFYVPAGVGHRGRHPVRIYYPEHWPIPMPAPGGAPPPPPPGGHAQIIVPEPVPSMTPVAAGTPINGRLPPAYTYDGSFVIAPPSPIRAVGMDAPRGILKNVDAEHSAADDSYLFCNVPEHHDLEDYIAELQESIKKLKMQLSKEKNFQEESLFHEERRNIKKLLTELEDRRDELEGLDLAIERQKRNLKNMKREEKELKRDRKDALGELDYWRMKNNKRIFTRRQHSKENHFDNELERNRQKYIKDELMCLEKTLAKRQAQLKETERNLKECKSDLIDAKDQARSTVKSYDEATSNLHQTLREQQEIEKRSNNICVELVAASENLGILKAEVRDIEKKKGRQEKLLREINNIIAKKDSEFKDLDSKVKSTSQNLQRLLVDLTVQTEREKEVVDTLRDSEDILAKRRAEVQRIRDQIDQSRQGLEKLDQQMGKKRTELALLEESKDRKQQELTIVLQDAEAEIAARHREIKDCRDQIDQLVHHKADLSAHIKTKRMELQKLKEEREQEEEVLQCLTNNVNKNKSDLKHTLEMQKIELTELENVKVQHAQKMVELERTQRALLEEKSDLEHLNAESARKNADLERLRQTIDHDRQEVDQLNTEKQNLEDRIVNLTQDQKHLDENCKTLDDKLNNMKRNQRSMEEKIDSTNSRLEILETELRVKERENEEAEIQNQTMQREINSLKQSMKESKAELNTLQDSIREAEDKIREVDQDMRNMFLRRDEAKVELEHLNEQIRQSSLSYEEHSRQEKIKIKELQNLIASLDERAKEHQEAKMTLSKIRGEVEKEKDRLNRNPDASGDSSSVAICTMKVDPLLDHTLVSKANSDLEMVRAELSKKQVELEAMKMEYTELQKKTDELEQNEEKVAELSNTCRDLEKGLHARDVEKTELAKALSASYEEVQRLRQESSQMQEKNMQEQASFDSSVREHDNFDQPKQEVKQVGNQSPQASEFQSSAGKHIPENSLEAELSHDKQETVITRKQCNKLSDDKENKAVTDHRTGQLPSHTSVSAGQPFKDYDWRNNLLREKLAQERDYLRFHLQQQMLRHLEVMKSARLKSGETIDCLRWKLNSLQEVLFNTAPDVRAMQMLARARSRSGSPGYRIGLRHGHSRSPSPLNTSSHSNYLAQKRSRSFESLGSPVLPERDYL